MAKDRTSKTFFKAREFLNEELNTTTCMVGEVTAFDGYMDAYLKIYDGTDTTYLDLSSGDNNEDLRRINRLLSFIHNFRDALVAAHKWTDANKAKQTEAETKA